MCFWLTSVLCRPAKAISFGAAHVYSAREKRLLSALVTLHVLIHTWIPIHIDIDTDTQAHTRTHKEPLLNSYSHMRPRPPPSGQVEGHVFVSRCQDAGVCSCASRSICFIFFSRGCPFVCGPVSFQPTPIFPPRGRQCVCCSTDTLALFIAETQPSSFPGQCYCSAPMQSLHKSALDLQVTLC